MRCIIKIRKNSDLNTGFNYQYGLASMLYSKMRTSNPELAHIVHEDKGYKFFTFSNLKLYGRNTSKKGLKGLDYKTAEMIFSSPNEKFIRSFVEGLLIDKEFYLEGAEKKEKILHTIEEIRMLPSEEIGNTAHFRAISPVYVKTFREEDGKLKNIDLNPSVPKFYENIQKNIIAKYNEFYNTDIKIPSFEIYDISDIKLKRIKIAREFRRCSFLSFKVQAPPEVIKFMYDAGIGEKNAMGFGCLELIENKK